MSRSIFKEIPLGIDGTDVVEINPRSRSKVTKITLVIDGTDVVEIDPAETDALFFTEKAVRDILAPYYAAGPGAGRGIDPLAQWNTKDATGKLPTYMIKIPMCSVKIG